jgi:hypothetical protein
MDSETTTVASPGGSSMGTTFLLKIMLTSVAAVVALHSQNPGPVSRHQDIPKCTVQDARDCQVSKSQKDFIRWKAPENEHRYVCFDSPYPFAHQTFHISPGRHEDSGAVIGNPASGTKFTYSTDKHRCGKSQENTKKTAVVIIRD